jgi:hypothetical protein
MPENPSLDDDRDVDQACHVDPERGSFDPRTAAPR